MVTFTGSDLQINNAYECGGNRIPPVKQSHFIEKNVLILVLNFSSFFFTSRSNKKIKYSFSLCKSKCWLKFWVFTCIHKKDKIRQANYLYFSINHDHAKESVPLNFTAGYFIRLWHNEALKMNISNNIYTSIYILMNKKKICRRWWPSNSPEVDYSSIYLTKNE